MLQDKIHNQICSNFSKVKSWFEESQKGLKFPVYSSFDMRDSGSKIAPVDANVFPAGFNNICDVDKESAAETFKNYISVNYGVESGVIGLLTEEHRKNPYYWENVFAIKTMIENGGFKVVLGFPRELKAEDHPEMDDGLKVLTIESINGHRLAVYGLENKSGQFFLGKDEPKVVFSNNDFTSDYAGALESFGQKINPPPSLGWHKRRKSQFFALYNELVAGFAKTIEIDPRLVRIKTQLFDGFDINSDASREALADKVEELLQELTREYKELEIPQKPFVFVKNNSGTYGLGVVKVESGQDILDWNYKTKKKMKATKGGGSISEVIIQEGITTRFVDEGVTAEPAIYLIGSQLAGGFLRTHSKKGPEDSLNAPGAIYKKLCVSDLRVDMVDCPMENVYGWLSRIGSIAIAKEMEDVVL